MIAIWTRTDCYEWGTELYGLSLRIFDTGHVGAGRFHAFVFDGGDTMESGTFENQETARLVAEEWAKGIAINRAPCPQCGGDLGRAFGRDAIESRMYLLCRVCGYNCSYHEFTDAELGFAEVSNA